MPHCCDRWVVAAKHLSIRTMSILGKWRIVEMPDYETDFASGSAAKDL